MSKEMAEGKVHVRIYGNSNLAESPVIPKVLYVEE